MSNFLAIIITSISIAVTKLLYIPSFCMHEAKKTLAQKYGIIKLSNNMYLNQKLANFIAKFYIRLRKTSTTFKLLMKINSDSWLQFKTVCIILHAMHLIYGVRNFGSISRRLCVEKLCSVTHIISDCTHIARCVFYSFYCLRSIAPFLWCVNGGPRKWNGEK